MNKAIEMWEALSEYLYIRYWVEPQSGVKINVGEIFTLKVRVKNVHPDVSFPHVSFEHVEVSLMPDTEYIEPLGPEEAYKWQHVTEDGKPLLPGKWSGVAEIQVKAIANLMLDGEDVVEDIGRIDVQARLRDEFFIVSKSRRDIEVDIKPPA